MIISKAREIGFHGVGFTSAEAFESQARILEERQESYSWAEERGLRLQAGTRPADLMQDARSIIVLLENYYSYDFPDSMTGKFGRCYMDDDRVTKDGMAVKLKAFRSFLRENGIESTVPFYVPHRLAAARAGLGSFGKNCMFYAHEVALGSSWVIPVTVLVNQVFEPDLPTIETKCPEWCRNACIAACPTGALKANGKIDPRRCISYLSYYGEGITPRELREPMGMWIYGCDRCQTVCPRNEAWMSQSLPLNPRIAAKARDFDLTSLLHMDLSYFRQRIWPHMFYMSDEDLWRWKMNVARSMGNSRNQEYIPELVRAFQDNEDERVLGMIAWSVGRLGGAEALGKLASLKASRSALVDEEIKMVTAGGPG